MTWASEPLVGTNCGKGGLLTAPWMVPGGTNYSAVDSPGGPLLGGTKSMTVLCTSESESEFIFAII